MADRYPKQLVGVSDGTVTPALKADGREIGAKTRIDQLSKVTGTAWPAADRFYLGRKANSEKVAAISLNADTSLGTSTISIGTAASPAKYVNAATVTAVNQWVSIGPLAATLDDAIPEDEELWATVGTTTIAGGTALTIMVTKSGL